MKKPDDFRIYRKNIKFISVYRALLIIDFNLVYIAREHGYRNIC